MTENETPDPQRSSDGFPWLSRAAAGLLVVSTMVVAVVADFLAPRNILLPVVYAVPLLLCAWVADRRFLWGLAVALAALNFAQYYVGREPLEPYNDSVMLINRWLSAMKIFSVAVVVHFLIGARRKLEAQTLAVARHRDELAQANQEISQREQEIVRQNEELQSQAEELERQSEELRLANEELASREAMLEQLLDLSRSLTPELTRTETLQRICEALGTLSGNLPITVLERRDHDLLVTCHNGFGPDGPASSRIPYAESFSALVIGRGQTGYIEDLAMRPELKIPQPTVGEPFRAVLAAPLKVRGRIIGAIELYARHKRSWGEAQVILVESLAAQTAISLAAAELVDAIQQERRRFESAFRTVPFGMMVAEDTEATQVHINPAGAAMLGVPVGENLSPATPVGARVRRYIFKNDRPVRHEDLPLSRALRGEEVQGEELSLSFPTGKRLSLLASAAPLYDGAGRVAGAVCAFADITELKTLQRELDLRRREAEETSVRKTRFLAAVSHDIRTPVNAINLMAEVIKRYAADPAVASQIPELAKKLQANALSLVELVSDVLDVARFDSGKIELIETEFDLHELLAEECRQLQPLTQEKNIQMRLEPADRPIWLRTDRVKLARIVSNLVGNAIKFTERGSVTVRTALTSDVQRRVVIQVADTGVGIPPEHQAAIFDEFAQVHNPERDRTKGTGLGLAICKRLVSVMGGALGVESQPGQGSTFTIALPASCVLLRIAHRAASSAVASSAAAPSAPETGNALAGLCVLLVEDHATTREGAARILTGEGATVLEADGGRSALEMLSHGGVDIVLLDMMMPDLDGREVLRAIEKERPRGLKGVLVLTGDLTPERLDEVKRLGADGLISKPIDVHVLADTLKTFLQPKRK